MARITLGQAWEIGRELNEIRESTPYGQFGKMLAEAGLAKDTVYRYMTVARIRKRQDLHLFASVSDVLRMIKTYG